MTGKILPIVGYGSPILKEMCVEAENNPETLSLVDNLLATMYGLGSAVGLAAPQVNSNSRIFVMCVQGEETVMINPVVISRGGKQKSEEGCMSIPGLNGIVPDRNEIMNVEYYDSKFNKKQLRLRGFACIVFQHEYDHLNGILYTDRMTKEGREKIADQLATLEKGHTRTHYDMIFPKTDIIQIKL